eukprot:6181663-Pleurochrysis_carterae.AAC.3
MSAACSLRRKTRISSRALPATALANGTMSSICSARREHRSPTPSTALGLSAWLGSRTAPSMCSITSRSTRAKSMSKNKSCREPIMCGAFRPLGAYEGDSSPSARVRRIEPLVGVLICASFNLPLVREKFSAWQGDSASKSPYTEIEISQSAAQKATAEVIKLSATVTGGAGCSLSPATLRTSSAV